MNDLGAIAEGHFLGKNKIELAIGSTVRKDVFDSLPEHVKDARDLMGKNGSLVSKNLELFEVIGLRQAPDALAEPP
jgi:hypothetical protein